MVSYISTDLEFRAGYVRGVGQYLDGLLEHSAEGVISTVATERRRVRTAHFLSRQVDYLQTNESVRIVVLYYTSTLVLLSNHIQMCPSVTRA